MAWVDPRSWSAGDAITAARLNDISDALNWLLNMSRIHVKESTGSYTTTSASYTAVGAHYTVAATVHGGVAVVVVSACMGNSGGAAYPYFLEVDVDGTGYQLWTGGSYLSSLAQFYSTVVITGLSDASHTFSLKYKIAGGDTLTIAKTYLPLAFDVIGY